MLPKENRLTDDYDFRRVKRLGKSYHCPFFKLSLAPRKIAGPSRFGFVISTKIDKRATVRNRIKRLLREAMRERLEKIPDGFDLVVMPLFEADARVGGWTANLDETVFSFQN